MNNIDKKIYLLYFFLLPFGKLLHLEDFIDSKYMFVNISSFVMLFGVTKLLLTNQTPRLLHMSKWWNMFAFTTAYSFIMAVVFFFVNTTYIGRSTFECIPRSIVLNFLAITSIYYNSIAFLRYVNFEDLLPIIKKQNIILLCLGYIQLGLLYGVPGCAQINDGLSTIFSIKESGYLINGDRGITLFGSEPSSIATLMVVTIPFILAIDIKNKKWTNTILWSIIYLTSGSSQALGMFLLGLCVALYIRYKEKVLRAFYILSFSLGMFMAFYYAFGIDVNREIANDGTMSYILYGKLVDVENQSTCTRVSSIINDIYIFRDFPITGVGDGLQGLFYVQNVPQWCTIAEEVQIFMSGEAVASGGGNFFASYMSAFGIIGIIVLIGFVKKYREDRRLYLNQCDITVSNASSIGLIMFLATGWYTISFFNNEYVPVMLSLPYLGLSTYTQIKR